MYPQDLLATGGYKPTGFLPALHKRPAETLFTTRLIQQQDQDDSSDDERTSSKRFKPSSPLPAMTLSRHKTTSSALTSARSNMSASHSITLLMLQPHFETPLAQVAKHFGICVTLLKKICRKHGISRWPHRQITGLRKSIASMEHAIGYFEGARRESYAEQLHKQKTKLALLLEDPTKCSPLPAATRLVNLQYQQLGDQDEYYQASVASSPASSSSFPSPQQQQQVSRSTAFPQSHQLPHQQLFTAVDNRNHQFSYPTLGFPASGLLHLPRPQHLQPQQQPVFYLPPLRREPRRMLPPIASLVTGNASW